MHDEGEGTPEDLRQAILWYRKAADQGHAAAQYTQYILGNMYHFGKGVPKDYSQAAFWYGKAAEQGHADAQYRLGDSYRFGEGVPKDHGQAVFWYRKAAEQGDAAAQYRLGDSYRFGEGLPKDYSKAVFWYRKAVFWYRKAADAQYRLGDRYYLGDGVPEDKSQAAFWYRKAAEQGDADVQCHLGGMYSKGEGVPKDYVRAYAWLNLALAAEQNYRHRLAEERRNTLQERINTLQEHMTVDQIAEAQKLSHELAERIGGGPLSLPLPFEPPQYQSNGSGFIVSDEGHIVTNYHVIENCDRVTVNLAGKMYDAEVATTNADNDLALLKAERALGTPAAFSRSERAPLNSDVTVAGFHVTVAGFPLQGILSKTLNVTRGSVSSEHGLGGNSGKFQLTAPIQGGNSGGPVLDKAGNVVGVVVSKLADKDAQNVNFAIKSQRVRGFLDLNGVSYRRQSSDSEREPERIASMAKGFTVAIYCYH